MPLRLRRRAAARSVRSQPPCLRVVLRKEALPLRTFFSSCDPGPHLAMLIWSAAATLANDHPSMFAIHTGRYLLTSNSSFIPTSWRRA